MFDWFQLVKCKNLLLWSVGLLVGQKNQFEDVSLEIVMMCFQIFKSL